MIKAVIFDMNGVIINDERFHQESWRILCQRYPDSFRTPTEEQFKHDVFGRTEKDTLQYLTGRLITLQELEEYSNSRVAIVKELFNPPLLTEGLGTLLRQIAQDRVLMGIATSSRPNYVDHILGGLGIRKYFRSVITAQDITKGKPDPEIYLRVSQELGIAPKDCLVFEDALSGIRSARDAGMNVIAIASTHEPSELALADNVIGTFHEVRFDKGFLITESGYQLPIEGNISMYPSRERE